MDLNLQHGTVVKLINEPLFSECYFDTDLVKRWQEFNGEGDTIRRVWGYVKNYLELVDHLRGEDLDEQWNNILVEVDDNTDYPSRDSFMDDWIELQIAGDPSCLTYADMVLDCGQNLRNLRPNHPLLEHLPPPLPAPATPPAAPDTPPAAPDTPPAAPDTPPVVRAPPTVPTRRRVTAPPVVPPHPTVPARSRGTEPPVVPAPPTVSARRRVPAPPPAPQNPNSSGNTSNHQAGGQVGLGQSPNGEQDREEEKENDRNEEDGMEEEKEERQEEEDKMEEEKEEQQEEEDKMDEDKEEPQEEPQEEVRMVEDEEERPGPQSQADPNGQEETRDETMLDDDPNAGDTAGPEGDMDMAEGVTDDVIVGRFWGITPS